MRRITFASLMGLIASLMMQSSSFGVVIGNWEQSTDGWIDWANGSALTANYSYSTEGATLGTYSLEFNPAVPPGDSPYGSGYYQALSNKLENNSEVTSFLNNHIFSISVTYDSSKWVGSSYATLNLIVNAPGFGFTQLPASTITDTGNPGFPGGWDPVNYSGITTRTISWNYSSALAAIPASPGYVELILVSSTDATTGAEFFDDAQLTGGAVPEPATLGLLGTAGLGLLLRRRRAA